MESINASQQLQILIGILGGLIGFFGALITAGVSLWITKVHNRKKEQRELALELFLKLMTDEYFIKARLISQSYLLPDGAKYIAVLKPFVDKTKQYTGLKPKVNDIRNFLSETARTEEDREARFYIRAITNFFWSVELARKDGLIKENEKLFSKVYSYYWHFIIKPYVCEKCVDKDGVDVRCPNPNCEKDEQFRKFVNLLKSEDDEDYEREYDFKYLNKTS